MKRGHCSRFAVPHTSTSITPLSPPVPLPMAAASPASCGMEEVLRDPPVPWSRGCATPREVKQLLQDANLWKRPTELWLGVTAWILLGAGISPRAVPHPALLLRESASSAERQGRASTAPPATSTCPSLRDRAGSCSNRALPPAAHPGKKGFLPGTARPVSPTPRCP